MKIIRDILNYIYKTKKKPTRDPLIVWSGLHISKEMVDVMSTISMGTSTAKDINRSVILKYHKKPYGDKG